MKSVRFQVSDVQVLVEVDHEPARRGLEAVWSGAPGVIPVARVVQGRIHRRPGGGGTVTLDGVSREETNVADLLPSFEALLYEALPR